MIVKLITKFVKILSLEKFPLYGRPNKYCNPSGTYVPKVNESQNNYYMVGDFRGKSKKALKIKISWQQPVQGCGTAAQLMI